VKAGYPMVAGRAPFGYTYVSEPHKGWLVVNEEEAAIPRDVPLAHRRTRLLL
jgi:hypothetical protein